MRGNALFIILICVVLFAALSYAISQGFRGGNEAMSKSRQEALIVDMISTAANYEKAVNKLINKGNSESRVSFTRASGDGYELSPVSAATERVFSVSGGGANYIAPSKDALDTAMSGEPNFGDWVFTGHNAATGNGSNSEGDLIALLPYVRKEICVMMNTRLNIANLSVDTPHPSNGPTYVNTKFTGTFSGNGRIKRSTYFRGKMGCFEGTTDESSASIAGRYYFYYVLIPR